MAVRLRNGDLVETVLELEKTADLVIIGKRGGAADFAKLHLGSNVERVVRSTARPVLVAARSFRPIERFLIAYDGSAGSERAIDYVSRAPLLRGLECEILTVGAGADLQARLDEVAKQLADSGFSVRASLEAGTPEEVIAQAVEREAIGLLVMGAYGHTRIRSLIIGSTTSAMVTRCKIPVLMLR